MLFIASTVENNIMQLHQVNLGYALRLKLRNNNLISALPRRTLSHNMYIIVSSIIL